VKLVQSNIWCGKLKYQLIDFMAAEQPDIVCMQEVNDLPGPPGPLFASLKELQAAGKFTASHMAPTCSYKYMNRKLHHGNAILSKLPIISSDILFTHGAYKDDYDRVTDDNNARNLEHVVLEAASGRLHVLNYHGYHDKASKDGSPLTLEHARKIVDYIKPLEGPVILTGDFNLVPQTESIAVIDDLLTNLSTKYRLENTYTHLSIHKAVCDYIFVNDLVKVKNFYAADVLISDHKALILEFDL
jgi:endonuclease/exonuclease/phosphatase family metal-dependent hydrolase